MKPAEGENPDPFYRISPIKQPIISPKANIAKFDLKETVVYDFQTEANQSYRFH
jgi:alpha-L-fucosidase 2